MVLMMRISVGPEGGDASGNDSTAVRQVATQFVIERANKLSGDVHGFVASIGECVGNRLEPLSAIRAAVTSQALTGLGFKSATVAAWRTTFDCLG